MSSTGGRDRLQAELERTMRLLSIPGGSRIVVAVSGGADSTALLCALRDCCRTELELTAVHVSHGIRPADESAREILFLQELCERLGVAFRVETIRLGLVRNRAAHEHRSLEDVARELRYQILERAANEVGADFIAMAHTLDDQLETVLMRLLQGATLRGIAGIPSRRGRIVRPILGCTRKQVLAFLDSRGIDHRFDATNEDERYLRNRIRKRIVPAGRGVFPRAAHAAGRLASEVRTLDALLETCTRLLVPWEAWGGGYRVEARQFYDAPEEIRVRSILSLYDKRGLANRIPHGFFERLSGARPRRSGGRLLEGHGAVVEQVGESVFWHPDVVLKTKTSYLMHVFEPSMYHITPALCFTVSTVPKGSAGGRGIVLPESLVRHPLVVRSRKPGDTIHMKEGTKSLKKLFNEWGVPESDRDAVPIVEDRGGIWAVCGRVLGYRDRVRYLPNRPAREGRESEEILFAFETTGDKA